MEKLLSLIISGNLLAKVKPGVIDDKYEFKIIEVISSSFNSGNDDITYDSSGLTINITVELGRTQKSMQDIKDLKAGMKL